MQNCPMFPKLSQASTIEGFAGGVTSDKSCNAGLIVTGPPEKSFISERNRNIDSWQQNFNKRLADYLNTYSVSLQSGNNDSQDDTSVKTSKKNLYGVMHELDTSNQKMQSQIHQQQKYVDTKTQSIQDKSVIIGKQTDAIDTRNIVLNSRKRQVELGMQKNIYKRNVMYFLIFVNIIVLLILFYIIRR